MADLDRLPDGVSIDTSKKVIQCTRSALEKLGDWCTQTAQALGLTLIVTAGANTALAQGANTKTGAKVEVTLVPRGTTPIPVLDAEKLGALSVESVDVPSTSASAAADKKDGGQIFDTRFGKMTGKEIMESSEKDTILESLSRSQRAKILEDHGNEAIKQNGQKIATGQKLDATNGQKIATGQKLDATNGQKIATISDIDQRKVEKVATISALDMISGFQKRLKGGNSLSGEEKTQLLGALNSPGIRADIRANMIAYTQ